MSSNHQKHTIPKDQFSASNTNEFIVDKYTFDLFIDIYNKKIEGSVILSIRNINNNCKELHLDVHNISINSVSLNDNKLNYETIGFKNYGDDLKILLPDNVDNHFDININYICGGGDAIFWLDSEQTSSKKYPYMFTQGESIYNRGLFPCQDTPAVKAKYSAQLRIIKPLKVAMSAKLVREYSDDTFNIFEYDMDQVIPSYLMAIVAGEIDSLPIGPRSKVWAELPVLPSAQKEFDEITEKYLKIAEDLFGPYLWGEYDIVIMPPSFPFGGMENPRLTFVTNCIIAGDKSLTHVIAHEIAHSWFGNLVTNGSWVDFWLNEGFTCYAEFKIMDKLLGTNVGSLMKYNHWKEFTKLLDTDGYDNNATRLCPHFSAEMSPEDTFNTTPYEKGSCLVRHMESLVGSETEFNNWLKSYINKFKFLSILKEDMFDYFFECFPHLKSKIDMQKWIDEPGLPPILPHFDNEANTAHINAVFQDIITNNENGLLAVNLNSWTTAEMTTLLDFLISSTNLNTSHLHLFNKIFDINKSINSEIIQRYCEIILITKQKESYLLVDSFISRVGRQKHLLPLYQIMANSDQETKTFAKQIFEKTRSMLHGMVVRNILNILK